jgi:hypothetical protein
MTGDCDSALLQCINPWGRKIFPLICDALILAYQKSEDKMQVGTARHAIREGLVKGTMGIEAAPEGGAAGERIGRKYI